MTKAKKAKARKSIPAASKEAAVNHDIDPGRGRKLSPEEIRERAIKAANAAIAKFAHELR
jgi:hypothetical protein